MIVQIFDVEHGACALITTPQGCRVMIDCGHNATTGWYPGTALSASGITALDMLVITNYDEDHVSGLNDLREHVEIRSLLRNKAVSSGQIRALKAETGIGPGIETLCDMIDEYTGPGSGSGSMGFQWEVFGNTPADFDDENNLSLIFSATLAGATFTFCGDMETAGWKTLDAGADGARLRAALNRTNVLVAPHHGRESGWWDGFRENSKNLNVTVISDDYIQYKTQETNAKYAALATGISFHDSKRKVLTTRNDGAIRFRHDINGWKASGSAHRVRRTWL
jgi:beta-lactamase superfamily II metal-dependent hydrolase